MCHDPRSHPSSPRRIPLGTVNTLRTSSPKANSRRVKRLAPFPLPSTSYQSSDGMSRHNLPSLRSRQRQSLYSGIVQQGCNHSDKPSSLSANISNLSRGSAADTRPHTPSEEPKHHAQLGTSDINRMSHPSCDEGTEFAVYDDLRVGQRVEARILHPDGTWGIWRWGTVLRRWIQRAFIDNHFTCYEVQITGKSERNVPDFYSVASFNGGLWDGAGRRPSIPVSSAIANLAKFQTVLARDPVQPQTWVPAKVMGSILLDPLVVIYHPAYAPSLGDIREPSKSTPLTVRCPWPTQSHPMAKCECRQVQVRGVHTYCPCSISTLRAKGCNVVDHLPL